MLSFKSADECKKFLKENGISQFDIKFCDLIGSWHHITLSASSVDSNIFENGVGFDSSSIPRFKDVRSGDMAARPDLSSCFIDTSFEIPTLCAIADVIEAGSAEETPDDPRSVLKRALKYLKKSGVGDSFTCAPELEFYIFSEAGFMNDPYGTWFRLSAPGVGRPIGEETMGASQRMAEGRGYLAAHPHDWWQNERAEMAARIAEVGLPIRYHHVEIGAAGQQEIEIGFCDAMEAADGILLGKYIVRDVAVERGIEACFMPKPIAGAAGSGLHIHFRILKKGKNLFAGEGYGGLSEFGKFFLGGVLSHGRA
ncbi:MAG: glutamine synthetase family protein, partial [bacterium]